MFSCSGLIHHGMTTDVEGIDSVRRAALYMRDAGVAVLGCTACRDFDVLNSNDGVCEFCGTIKRG